MGLALIFNHHYIHKLKVVTRTILTLVMAMQEVVFLLHTRPSLGRGRLRQVREVGVNIVGEVIVDMVRGQNSFSQRSKFI